MTDSVDYGAYNDAENDTCNAVVTERVCTFAPLRISARPYRNFLF